MNTSPDIKDLAAALAIAQGQIETAKKDSTNPHFKSKYADLTSVWEACRVALCSNGIAVVQSPESREGLQGVVLVTRLIHSSGQWLEGELHIPVNKQDAQAVGTAISYGRRYSLAAMVGVVAEDDDGTAASKNPPEQKPLEQKPLEQKPSKPQLAEKAVTPKPTAADTKPSETEDSGFKSYIHDDVTTEDVFSEAKLKRLLMIGQKLFNLTGDLLHSRMAEAATKILKANVTDLGKLHWRDGGEVMRQLEEQAVKRGVWEAKT